MNFIKLNILLLFSVITLQIRSQDSLIIKTKVFDYLYSNTIKLKQCIVDDSICSLQNNNLQSQLRQRDTIITNLKNINSIQGQQIDLEEKTSVFIQNDLNREVKKNGRIKVFSAIIMTLEAVGIGWFAVH